MYIYLIALVGLIISLLIPSFFTGFLLTVLYFGLTLISYQRMIIILFVYYPIRPLITTINPSLILIGDIVILTTIVLVLYKNRYNVTSAMKSLNFGIYFLLFIIIGTILGYINGATLTAITLEVRNLLVLALLVPIFYLGSWNKKFLNEIISLSVITAFFISIHGIIEKLFSRSVLIPEEWKQWELSAVNIDRVYGTLGNPNILATYLTLVLLISLTPSYNIINNKLLLLFIQATIIYTIFLTGSRGTLIMFVVGLVLYLIMTKHWLFLRKLLVSVILAIVIYGVPFQLLSEHMTTQQESIEQTDISYNNTSGSGMSFTERLKTMFSDETIQASTEWGRIYIVIKGLEVFKDHPIFGTGFATFGDSATQNHSSPIYKQYQINEKIYADNQYIHILVSTGITGTILLIAFVVHMFYKLLPNSNHYNNAILISLTSALLVGCVFYSLLEDKTFTLFYYSILGVLISHARGKNNV